MSHDSLISPILEVAKSRNAEERSTRFKRSVRIISFATVLGIVAIFSVFYISSLLEQRRKLNVIRGLEKEVNELRQLERSTSQYVSLIRKDPSFAYDFQRADTLEDALEYLFAENNRSRKLLRTVKNDSLLTDSLLTEQKERDRLIERKQEALVKIYFETSDKAFKNSFYSNALEFIKNGEAVHKQLGDNSYDQKYINSKIGRIYLRDKQYSEAVMYLQPLLQDKADVNNSYECLVLAYFFNGNQSSFNSLLDSLNQEKELFAYKVLLELQRMNFVEGTEERKDYEAAVSELIQKINIDLTVLDNRLKGSKVQLALTGKNTSKNKIDPSTILLSFTVANKSLERNLSYFKDLTAKPHVVITREGEIIQFVPFNIQSNTLPRSLRKADEYLPKSISIFLDNYGFLKKVNNEFRVYYPSGTYNEVPGEDVFFKVGSNRPYWQNYTPIQVIVVQELLKALDEAYQIKEVKGFNEISPMRLGPGPAFPMTEVKNVVEQQ